LGKGDRIWISVPYDPLFTMKTQGGKNRQLVGRNTPRGKRGETIGNSKKSLHVENTVWTQNRPGKVVSRRVSNFA